MENVLVNVEELAAGSSFKIYPNPSSTFLNIEDESLSPFNIYTLDGKLIYQSAVDQKRVDVSSFEKGIYLVTKAGRSKKLVIQ